VNRSLLIAFALFKRFADAKNSCGAVMAAVTGVPPKEKKKAQKVTLS